ncbi:branched-chain amino acid ABC transporter permease [Pseudomonas sp. FSL R10-1350]|uniref:branched-chain amino acid ABC transporter permease n=1 Tax=Pseudomonas sp. FSL R10-1350 TaxID=2662197 RepID=UPI0012974377|nr:branched-chain amino acid ABC transporter permease [Pseudomonas sp. FSL R10-1350]MQU66229.1 branched-chain amino acid ABC transporter permease [Pseudomonas sp. FSL R10-1350]
MKLTKILLLVLLLALVVVPAVVPVSMVNASIQMLIAALFACAFNLLCGQGGMLSFGHAAYFGVGSFATLHAMNALNGHGLLPTPLLPLIGALGGFICGVCAGWFATKRAGVYFSMITLALAELLHSLAPHLSALFGGEAGISSMRSPAWGLDFGDATQVYYLTLVWVVMSIALLYAFTLTPMGRLTFALRENGHRLQFLGYNVHRLRVLVFALSAMFSGIAGGLQALNLESANYVLFDMHYSAEVVLNTYIGGVNVFLGPVLGAALMTFFGNAASDLTQSWLLYQGLLFVLVMMFMPSGLAGLVLAWSAQIRRNGWLAVIPAAVTALLTAALVSLAVVFAIETLQRVFSQDYQALLIAGQPWPAISLFGRDWLPGSPLTWAMPLLLGLAGLLMLKLARRRWLRLLDDERGSKPAALTLQAEGDAP